MLGRRVLGLVHLALVESGFPGRLLVVLQAIAATVDLGDADVGQLAELRVQLDLVQGPVEREEALEQPGTMSQGPQEIRHLVPPALDFLEMGPDGSRPLPRSECNEPAPW